MTKNILLACGFVLALTLNSVSAKAASKELPKTFSELQAMSADDMKALPDVKWPLAKMADPADFKGKTEAELILLRNSIYAQQGFHFTDKTLGQYFASRTWYTPAKEETGVAPIPDKARDAARMLMQAQAQMNHPRGVADEGGGRSGDEGTAYTVFNMGFCTYKNKYDAKAGMIVFDTNGIARIFHSEGSQMDDGTAYTSNKEDATKATPSRMITGKWSIENNKRGSVILVTIDAASVPKDYEGAPKMKAGVREVLNPDNSKAVKARECTMNLR